VKTLDRVFSDAERIVGNPDVEISADSEREVGIRRVALTTTLVRIEEWKRVYRAESGPGRSGHL
jgi:hypothetical protein